LIFVVALGLCGCGGVTGAGTGDADITLLLGGHPTGTDAGIYLAKERGYDEANGINLTVRRHGDPAHLIRDDRIQAAVLDAPIPGTTCVMAILQEPRPSHFICFERTFLEDNRAAVKSFIQSIQRGYTEAEVDPESAVQAEMSAAGGLSETALTAQLNRVSPSFEAGVPAFGYLQKGKLPAGSFAFGLVGPSDSRD
jgi:ABC-type nitrate/sulfonate/bicarbonate transport system substrate-binding protein